MPMRSLSAAMREGSTLEHQQAEESAFITELLAGRVSAEGYADYLLRLRVVYATLESLLHERLGDPAVAAVHDPALERLAALEADLDHWRPVGPRHVDSPAATAYRERLVGVADRRGLLVAHHYTRYLGDLSGGQAIGRILDRTFGLEGRGVAFYEFEGVPKPKPYKDAYRARLDALDLSRDEQDRVVEEVKVAFRLNQALFAELGERLPAYARD